MASLKEAHDADREDEVLTYLLVKVQTAVAKVLNKMRDLVKAEDVCDDVIDMCGDTRGKHLKFAIKACYMKAKNMQSIMEFRKAKEILEEQAKPMLKKLIEEFGSPDEEGKDLSDSRYAFLYRKKFALYLKKFAFYDQANEVLEQILKDEMAFYGLEAVEGRPSLEGLTSIEAEEGHVLKPALVPHLQVRDTLYMLGKIQVFKIKQDKGVELLTLAQDINSRAFGGEQNLLYSANC